MRARRECADDRKHGPFGRNQSPWRAGYSTQHVETTAVVESNSRRVIFCRSRQVMEKVPLHWMHLRLLQACIVGPTRMPRSWRSPLEGVSSIGGLTALATPSTPSFTHSSVMMQLVEHASWYDAMYASPDVPVCLSRAQTSTAYLLHIQQTVAKSVAWPQGKIVHNIECSAAQCTLGPLHSAAHTFKP